MARRGRSFRARTRRPSRCRPHGRRLSERDELLAVGTRSGSGNDGTLVERWNGTAWSIMTSPNIADRDNKLAGVSCTSVTSCFAVGEYALNSAVHPRNTLVERWNGDEAWSGSCPPEHRRYAQGEHAFRRLLSQRHELLRRRRKSWCRPGLRPLPHVGGTVERYGVVHEHDAEPPGLVGRAAGRLVHQHDELQRCRRRVRLLWGSDAHVDRAVERNELGARPESARDADGHAAHESRDVTCTSTTNCFAVGSFTSPSGVVRTLTEHWNGTSWSVIAGPNPANTTGSSLSSVSCASDGNCVAVGTYFPSGLGARTLIERWDG